MLWWDLCTNTFYSTHSQFCSSLWMQGRTALMVSVVFTQRWSYSDLAFKFPREKKWGEICIRMSLFHSQQKPAVMRPINAALTANLAMAATPVAACDFWRNGDKTFFQMPARLWHLETCDPFNKCCLNGHNHPGPPLVIEVSQAQQWLWGQNHREGGS